MTPRTPAESLIADTVARALTGHLTVGPMDLLRLAAAAREVDPQRVAGLALERWIATDPRARQMLRAFAGR